MAVPLLDLKAQYQALKPQIDEAMLRVAASQACILGPEAEAMERDMEAYLGAKHAIGVSSGTDALLMAFMAYNIGPGDEVIVPTFSFFATAGCVSRLGAKPVFIDVDPVSFMMTAEGVRAAITPRTKAIVPVHLFGQAAPIDEIMAVANEHGIVVIEDAAQAIGTQASDGRRVGTIGQIGCFSFYPTKNLGAFGDGGLVTTNDDALAVRLKQIRNHGMEPKYYHRFIGGNFRLDAIQAAILRVKLPYLPEWHAARRANAKMYDELLTTVAFPASINAGKGTVPADHHIYNQYVIRSEHRDALRAFLTERGIGTEIYYPVPFHRQECFADLGYKDADFPVANALAESVLALPIYPELTRAQIEEVAATINEFERTVVPH